ncbi:MULTISPECIES: DegT/DnrJ/EryC1/StrS family aminotransferase [Lysobacter]|uniref:DegT/DnrJ/EryC1/StrS family aminotransferase n=1 Tax=Lysobacter firmicutimachus TaxID=1792846 RepID=A0ABU8CYX3_9GAMM|nr:DegT/DnrJ/EryC1/StrS family aminotransferase [Lysobacter antibioticus]
MQINDLSARIKANEQAITGAIQRVLTSGWLVLGPEVKQFESAFAQYLGVEYCVSVGNGTDAIELALRAFGVGPGDKVATVANAGMYTATAVRAIGAEPFFLDVDLNTRNVSLIEVERAIAAGVRFVVVTHLYGLATPEISQIAQLCAGSGAKLLEDCAQAHGAQVGGRMVGTFGDAASFSFYPTKNLGALGDGGAATTRHADVAERIRRLRQYGWTDKYNVEFDGARNTRLDEMQAAILSTFLPGLDAGNERRREIAARYNAGICHPQVEPPAAAGPEYVGHLYVLRSAQRDSLRQHLRAQGIASDIHYPVPDYRQPVFGDRYADVRLSNTERLAVEILTLPCYPEMTDAQIEQVVASVNSWQP